MSHIENPTFPLEDWKYECANGDTRLGYSEWLHHKIESAADDKRTAETPPAVFTERGAAAMLISFSGGAIVIRHGEDGTVLLKGEINAGFWDGLWAYITANANVTFRAT